MSKLETIIEWDNEGNKICIIWITHTKPKYLSVKKQLTKIEAIEAILTLQKYLK